MLRKCARVIPVMRVTASTRSNRLCRRVKPSLTWHFMGLGGLRAKAGLSELAGRSRWSGAVIARYARRSLGAADPRNLRDLASERDNTRSERTIANHVSLARHVASGTDRMHIGGTARICHGKWLTPRDRQVLWFVIYPSLSRTASRTPGSRTASNRNQASRSRSSR
jgi:hypothetical protein